MSEINKKILIVEDDKFLAKMLGRMLESHKYAIVLASSGQEGLEKSGDSEIGLILMDIMLPDIDGFELLSKIKSSDKLKNIPVIIMSNLGQAEDISQGKKLGVNDYIIKSDLSLDEVVEKIKKYLPIG